MPLLREIETRLKAKCDKLADAFIDDIGETDNWFFLVHSHLYSYICFSGHPVYTMYMPNLFEMRSGRLFPNYMPSSAFSLFLYYFSVICMSRMSWSTCITWKGLIYDAYLAVYVFSYLSIYECIFLSFCLLRMSWSTCITWMGLIWFLPSGLCILLSIC